MRKRGNHLPVKSSCSVLFALLLLLPSIGPHAEKVEEVLNPKATANAFVGDQAGVLGPEYFRLIDGICRQLQQKTGAEIAVVTVNNLGGLTDEEFAVDLFQRFRIGAAGKDNGILILFALRDRAIKMEVGYGLEGTIPDIRAGQLLDIAIPYFRGGQYGHGLYLATRDTAQVIASSQGATLSTADPASWPVQPAIPLALTQPLPAKKRVWNAETASLVMALAVLGLGLFGVGSLIARQKRQRARAAREKAIKGISFINVLIWFGSVVGFILILAISGRLLPPLIALVAAPSAATAGRSAVRKWLLRRLRSYQLACGKCGQPMNMVPESEDNAMLAVEEAAEERVGGMDYEIWKCGACGNEEKLEVKLDKAAKCPKCSRRTLTSSRETLAAATTSQGGRVRVTDTCQNPNCGFSRTREEHTAALSSGTSSSSFGHGGGSRSSSGSFGGGRSGGGGASKHW